jgi:hypothetical protein
MGKFCRLGVRVRSTGVVGGNARRALGPAQEVYTEAVAAEDGVGEYAVARDLGVEDDDAVASVTEDYVALPGGRAPTVLLGTRLMITPSKKLLESCEPETSVFR